MSAKLEFIVVRLGKSSEPDELRQFVAMMGRMYDFHATLHADWQPKENWQQGSENWIKRAAEKDGDDDYFFAIAYPVGPDNALIKDKGAGYVIASFHYEAPLFVQNRYGYIADLWVEPDFRKQGAAEQILAVANAWFKEQGVSRIQIEVDVENKSGHAFWQSRGYADFEFVMRADI